MKATRYEDTDTAYIELRPKAIVEPRELTPDVYVELDEEGNVVALTLEHTDGVQLIGTTNNNV